MESLMTLAPYCTVICLASHHRPAVYSGQPNTGSRCKRLPYVNWLSCCSSYFSFANPSSIVLPSFRFVSSSLTRMARWMSSIAPVTMTGQRSRAETKAKDALSEVTYGSTLISMLTFSAVFERGWPLGKSFTFEKFSYALGADC